MNKNFIPYIGGKYNLVGPISKRLHATEELILTKRDNISRDQISGYLKKIETQKRLGI